MRQFAQLHQSMGMPWGHAVRAVLAWEVTPQLPAPMHCSTGSVHLERAFESTQNASMSLLSSVLLATLVSTLLVRQCIDDGGHSGLDGVARLANCLLAGMAHGLMA